MLARNDDSGVFGVHKKRGLIHQAHGSARIDPEFSESIKRGDLSHRDNSLSVCFLFF